MWNIDNQWCSSDDVLIEVITVIITPSSTFSFEERAG